MDRVTDAFTRADSSSSLGSADTGQAWTQVQGTHGISSNQAYTSAAYSTGGQSSIAVIDSEFCDGVIQADIPSAIASDTGAQVIFRYTDASNYWEAQLYRSPSGTHVGIYLSKWVAGAATSPIAVSNIGNDAGPWTIRVECQGPTIHTFVNGTDYGPTADPFNRSATRHGLGFYRTTAIRLDNFVAKPTRSGYAAAIMADIPLAYWRLDERSGVLAVDEVGYNHGAYAGGYTLGVTGAVGSDPAVSLNGTSGYIATAASQALNIGHVDQSVECWVRVRSWAAAFALLDHTNGTGANGQVTIYADPAAYGGGGAGGLRASTWDDAVAAGPHVDWAQDIGTFFAHLVCTWDAGGTARLYRNGALVATGTPPGSQLGHAPTLPFVIGRQTSASAFFAPVDVQHVALYDHPLAADRVRGHFLCGTRGGVTY